MKRAEHQPETVSITIYGGIYYKVWHVPDAGTIIPQHSHRYPHVSALLQGTVRVWQDDKFMGEYRAPDAILIDAHRKHRFEAVTPCWLACIHNADRLEDDEPAIHEEHTLALED